MHLEKKFGAMNRWPPTCTPVHTYTMLIPLGRTGQNSLQVPIEIFLIKRTFKRRGYKWPTGGLTEIKAAK